MSALVEVPPAASGAGALEFAQQPTRVLGLPPGSVPLEAVDTAIRSYRSGKGTADHLIAAVDRHGDALGVAIAHRAVDRLADFNRYVARLEALHDRTADLVAQAAWLRGWPSDTDQPARPLSVELAGRRFPVPEVLAALRRTVQLDDRLVLQARRRRRGRRGAAASMAALADLGQTTGTVALAMESRASNVWAQLNGHQRVTPELRSGLERLVGRVGATQILDGIPQHPRAYAPASPAVLKLHANGITASEIAPLIPIHPSTVQGWLRGVTRPSPRLAEVLERLLSDAELAREVLALIPERPRKRAPSSPSRSSSNGSAPGA